jgi:HEAT repeat protein
MGTNCIPPLLAWLSDEAPGLNQRGSVQSTFQILGERASPAAPVLVQLTTNKNKELRRYAFQCLKAVKPEKAILVPALVTLLEDPDRNIGYSAAENLVEVDPDTAEKAGVVEKFPHLK